MKRYHEEQHILDSRQQFCRNMGLKGRYFIRGRMRKKRPLDCGRCRCKMCHGAKVWDLKSVVDAARDISFREMVDEL